MLISHVLFSSLESFGGHIISEYTYILSVDLVIVLCQGYPPSFPRNLSLTIASSHPWLDLSDQLHSSPPVFNEPIGKAARYRAFAKAPAMLHQITFGTCVAASDNTILINVNNGSCSARSWNPSESRIYIVDITSTLGTIFPASSSCSLLKLVGYAWEHKSRKELGFKEVNCPYLESCP